MQGWLQRGDGGTPKLVIDGQNSQSSLPSWSKLVKNTLSWDLKKKNCTNLKNIVIICFNWTYFVSIGHMLSYLILFCLF